MVRVFFNEFLKPESLNNFHSFDANWQSLEIAKKNDKRISLFLGDAYHVPIASESADIIAGLSSFDSHLGLGRSTTEAGRCLRPGGYMLLFQDCYPELHGSMDGTIDQEAGESYHRELCRKVRDAGLKILEGTDKLLSAFVAEPREEIRKRISGADIPWDIDKAFLLFSNSSQINLANKPSNFASMVNLLWVIRSLLDKRELEKLVFSPNNVGEVVVMRFLIAQKLENT